MNKPKKSKAPQQRTELDKIVTQLRAILRRETSDVVLAGDLLIESRKHLKHGEWQDWLSEHFDLSYRTAVNYCDAAKYAQKQKCNVVADFANLAPTVLYALAAGDYTEEEEAAILAATRRYRVDQSLAYGICDELAPEEPDEPDIPDEMIEAAKTVEAAEDAEIASILDGPPPNVPPPAPSTSPDFVLQAFDRAVNELKQLMTKPAARFASTVHTANDLQGVDDFIRTVADRLRETSDEPPVPAGEGDHG